MPSGLANEDWCASDTPNHSQGVEVYDEGDKQCAKLSITLDFFAWPKLMCRPGDVRLISSLRYVTTWAIEAECIAPPPRYAGARASYDGRPFVVSFVFQTQDLPGTDRRLLIYSFAPRN
jgi:hypothetical protein